MYISIDPAGTSITACFLFWSFKRWEFICFESKNWWQHVFFIEELVAKYRTEIECVAYEENPIIVKFSNVHFHHLIKSVAGMELYLIRNHINKQSMFSPWNARAKKLLSEKGIAGIKKNSKNQWVFKNQKVLNKHELDALVQFYALWTRILKNKWPFSD